MPLDDNDGEGSAAGQGEQVFLSRDVLRGVPWTVASKLALTGIFLAVSILTVHFLGPREYGVFTLCKTIVETVILVCGLGLGTALVRFIPELCFQRNKTGLIRLLVKSVFLHAAAILVVGGVLFIGRSQLSGWLGIEFDKLLFLTVALSVARLLRGFAEACLTAMYKVRANSILSVVHGLLYLTLVAVILARYATVNAALLSETLPLFLVGAISVYVLIRSIRSLPCPSPQYGVGKRRVLGMAFASLLNSFAMLFLRQYSEIFFLSYYFSKEIVGYYSLGCSVPLMLISLVPTAIQTLFTAGFAEAHSRDPGSLSRIICVFYKAIIIIVVPFSAFGLFFAARAVTLVYGADMAPAGPVTSLFCVIHVMPLISLPISMAIVAREKVMHVQPLMVLQVVINLILDYELIPRYGMYGAVAAVVITFLGTIPIRLYVVSRFIGGINFPTVFFIKFLLVGFGLAGLMSPVARYCSIPALALAGLVYTGGYFGAIRIFHLVRPSDFTELKRAGLPVLTKALNVIGG